MAKFNRPEKAASFIKKRSLVVRGHKTSVSLEDEFWTVLKLIAGKSGLTISHLVGKIDHEKSNSNLSSALRLYVLDYLMTQLDALEVAGGT